VKLEVSRITQNGKTLFFGVMPAKELFADRVKVERWFPGRSTAYQRALRAQKVDKIARFVGAAGGIMPSSVLLSVRELDASAFHKRKDSSIGVLEIPDDRPIYVVDGQHRIEGLRHAVSDYGLKQLEHYPLPVIFLPPSLWREAADPEIEEGKQFITINKTQTGVKGDLLDVFLLALHSVDRAQAALGAVGLPVEIVDLINPRVRALLVTLILNTTPGGPWKDLIARPNVRGAGTVIGQKAMVDSLDGLVNSATYKASYPEVKDIGSLAIAISHYWEAILDQYPSAQADPKHYWVQKRLGAYVFHRIFPMVDALAAKKTKEGYKAALASAVMKSESYWSKTGSARGLGTSFTAVSLLSNEMWPSPRPAQAKKP
jgi:DGQHR domain-containing protein